METDIGFFSSSELNRTVPLGQRRYLATFYVQSALPELTIQGLEALTTHNSPGYLSSERLKGADSVKQPNWQAEVSCCFGRVDTGHPL